jgi:hypothetical protein
MNTRSSKGYRYIFTTTWKQASTSHLSSWLTDNASAKLLIIFILSYLFVLPTSFLRISKTHNRTSLQVWHANVFHFCSFCKPTFSGATREWDTLYNDSLSGNNSSTYFYLKRHITHKILPPSSGRKFTQLDPIGITSSYLQGLGLSTGPKWVGLLPEDGAESPISEVVLNKNRAINFIFVGCILFRHLHILYKYTTQKLYICDPQILYAFYVNILYASYVILRKSVYFKLPYYCIHIKRLRSNR